MSGSGDGAGEVQLAESAPLALVVEDDPDAARIAAGMLRLLGYRSRVAADANEALYALTEGPPSLILMDTCLPVMDGVNLIKVARRVQGLDAVPVVATSAVYPDEGPVAKILANDGVPSFLSKPFTLNGLRAAIDAARSHALSMGPPPSPSMSEGMPSVTEEQIEEREADREREEAALAAERAEAARVAAETLATAASAARAEAGAAAREERTAPVRSTSSAGLIRSAPAAPSDSSVGDERAPETQSSPRGTADKLETRAGEILGQGTIDSKNFLIIVEEATRNTIVIKAPGTDIPAETMVRLEVRHHMAVQDAMSDILIRMLAQTTSVRKLPDGGTRARMRVLAVRPEKAYAGLIDYLERFANY